MSKHLIQRLAVILIAISGTTFAAAPARAADLRAGDTVTVARGEVVDGDLYVAGTDITIDGTVKGDIFCAGRSLIINGTVMGGVSFVGQTLTVNGEIAHGVRMIGQSVSVTGNIGRDLLIMGSSLTTSYTARIGGDVILAVGDARINGRVNGNIAGGAGRVTIAGGVGGNIELEVDKLTIATAASIQGNLTYTGKNEADIETGALITGKTVHKLSAAAEKPGLLSRISDQVIAFLMALLAGIVMILIAPERAAGIAATLQQKPWLSLGWGAIILFATPVAAIIAFITVIGASVGLIGLALYGIAIYMSQIAVALFIGYGIIGRFSLIESRGRVVGAMALGLVVLTLLKLIPHIGFPLWLATALFGIGAIVISPLQTEIE